MSRRAKADVWMAFYPDDYLRDTLHLSRDQHGGYLLLLIHCWSNDGRIRNDPAILAAVTKSTPGEWKKLAPILKPFFQVEGRYLVHKRVRAEIEKAQRMLETRRQNGAKGGRPRGSETEKEPVGYFQGTQQVNLPGGLQGNLEKTPARVEVEVSTSEVANRLRSPIQEEASDSQVSSGAKVIPLDGRGGR